MIYLFDTFRSIFGLMLKEGQSLTVFVVGCIITAAAAYLLGSLNSAIIVSKWKFKQDIRSFGSGNAGLTNMHRVYGKSGAGYTLFGDIAKQVASVLIGSILLEQTGAYIAGLFCILGHIFPVYYGFKGGKGVLTAATMILVIDPIVFAVLFAIFALVLVISRYVSLSSIIAALAYPAAVYNAAIIRGAEGVDIFEILFALFVGALIIFMHRSNIYRLFNNQESKFSFRKKPETQEILDMEDSENDSDNTYYPPATGKKKKNKR